MDNILANIPKKIKSNISTVTINNKLTFGDINIKNLRLKNKNNHINFNNIYGNNINVKPIMVSGCFNIFQFNNYGKEFNFDVDYSNCDINVNNTSKFYNSVNNLEEKMMNYNTGLDIKCYNKLKLENFTITSTTIGENIIYIRNCIINGDLNINLMGRSLVIIDNTDIIGRLKFNLVKHEIKDIKILNSDSKTNNNILMKSLNKKEEKKEDNVENNSNSSNKSQILMFLIFLIIIAIVGYYIMKNSDNIDNIDNDDFIPSY